MKAASSALYRGLQFTTYRSRGLFTRAGYSPSGHVHTPGSHPVKVVSFCISVGDFGVPPSDNACSLEPVSQYERFTTAVIKAEPTRPPAPFTPVTFPALYVSSIFARLCPTNPPTFFVPSTVARL